jgi:hypothetical protein
MGCIQEGTLGAAMADGTPIDVYCEGHVLVYHKDVEKTVTVTGTLVGVPADVMKEFWVMEDPDTDGISWVNSTMTPTDHAFRMSVPDVPGSDRFIIPKGSMNLGIGYASTAGWSMPFTITLTMGDLGHLFGWDTVGPAA